MEKVEIFRIEFENYELSSKNKNYPHSGLFIVKVTEVGLSDLRFVDKKMEFSYMICPEDVFYNSVDIIKDTFVELSSYQHEQNKFDGDFILEFSRILLNRK